MQVRSGCWAGLFFRGKSFGLESDVKVFVPAAIGSQDTHPQS